MTNSNAIAFSDYAPASPAVSFTPDQMALISQIVSQAVSEAIGRTKYHRPAATCGNSVAFPAVHGNAARPSYKPAPNGTVDPIRNKEDIVRMANFLRDKGGAYADRNYLFFMIGVNVGLRACDIVSLRYCDVLNDDGSVRDMVGAAGSVREQKTGKHRRQWINASARHAIEYYVKRNPAPCRTAYLFPSNKVSAEHVQRRSMSYILKPAAEALGIKGNINTHSMRKSWAYHYFMDNQQTPEALAYLQDAMNHSSSAMTLHYIGLADDRKREMFMGNCLGE